MKRAAWFGLVVVLVAANTINLLVNRAGLQDFGGFWASARAVLEGKSPYFHANLNPPHFVWVMAPLAWLSPQAALGLWTVLGVAAAVQVARSIWALQGPGEDRRWAGVVLLLGLAATGVTLQLGQVAFVLAWPMMCSWRAARDGRPWAAGVWLGLAAAVKPFLLLFPAFWLLSREWRPAAAALAVVAGVFGAGVLAIGPAIYEAWADRLRGAWWVGSGLNLSVIGFVDRLLNNRHEHFVPIAHLPSLVPPVALALTMSVLAFGAWLAIRRPDADRAYLGLGLLCLLCSPLGWVYYVWLFVGPLTILAFAWLRERDARSDRAVVALVLLCLPVVPLATAAKHPTLTLTLGSAYFWAALLLLWNIGLDLRLGTPASLQARSK